MSPTQTISLPDNTSPRTLPDIAGYTIVEQLYLGARTAVYRAVQVAQQRPVVIKVLRRDYPSFSELVQFRNQYTIAKHLPLAGIVQPLGLEPLDHSYALVMEDWGGIALGKYVEQQSFDLAGVLAIALQVTSILHELGQHRVVHKDIKPANILIHPESKQVKLIDFSIASLLPKETQELQSLNILEGTLAYIAPEQTGRMNRGIDYRADFYAFGVTLYQLLTGVLPFTSVDPLELIHCHIARMPVPIDQVKPDVPKTVAAIVAKLMAKNAEERYQSALGLKDDLAHCFTQWTETGTIADFKLGQRDLSDRFLIPEKLYGREAEVETLLTTFDRVAEGASELILVAGFSGIGKTAVVNEVHKPIVRQHGYFIKGKFDQFNRNIPLSAFVQALRDLMVQLLSESDLQVAQWYAKILAVLGENGQVLIEVIPELEQLIGKQPSVAELSGTAAQNRFNRLFQTFIALFTTADHPLVIFLDDLQWADLASLQLIRLLMNDNGHLLILGAYRDNEVSSAHPLMLTVDELKKAQAIVHTITLAPLTVADTNHLVADTLHCTSALAQPLTALIDRKTKGNPFFTTQFLKALHEEGQIRFNHALHYWECDIAQVMALSLTDDVVEFMALQLQKLPTETQQMLKLAACVGNQFDLVTLAIVSERSLKEAASALWKALQDGLILPRNQVYKFFQDSEPAEVRSTANPTYQFLHDRVQQAAYSMIAADHKQLTHLSIGQRLLSESSTSERKERLFEIVNHLNVGIALIPSPQEREKLAELNLTAGRKAKTATAYGAAIAYLTAGIALLPDDAWENHYPLTLVLHEEITEASYLNAEFEQMERWATLVLQKARTLLDTIPVQQAQLIGARCQGQLLQSLQIGLQALKSLSVEFPEHPTQSEIKQAFDATCRLWKGRSLVSLLDLPVMTDPYHLAATSIMSAMVASAALAAPALMPLLVFKQLELSIQYGNCPFSIFAYADYGLILCLVMGDVNSGYDFGQLALKLLDKLQLPLFKSRAWYVVYTFIQYCKTPLRESLPCLQEAYQCGLETGDVDHAGFGAVSYCYYAYHAGFELIGLADEIDAYRQTISNLKQSTPRNLLEIVQQTVCNLLGLADVPQQLSGTIFNKEESLPLLEAANFQRALFYVHFNEMVLSYLFGDYQQAAQSSILAEQRISSAETIMLQLYPFYDSLVQLALSSSSSTSAENQCQSLERVERHQATLQQWATLAPCNHQHRWELVAAEIDRVLEKNYEAGAAYDRAIAGAKTNAYIQEEALANELAARFYLNWGKEKFAASHLQEAYYGYARWGAKAKVQELERRYPHLLAPILQQQREPLSVTETVFSPEVLTTSQALNKQTSSSGSTSISATLDLATVLKASQTLSSEIQLDKLLATLLYTVLENAGAEKGALLMPREHQWFVEAIAILDQPAQVKGIALADSADIPHGLIHTVKRSLNPVVIVDAATHPLWATDAYVVQQQPRSLLCIPILHQGKLVAILYLENQVTVGAFTSDRVDLLNVLCAQAAISLQNARLYQQAQTYAQQLEQSQLHIVQSEKMASLGNLVAGIAHEINNPISFLNGSINNTKDYVQDLLRHLALYQQHHPNPATPVHDHADDIDLDYLTEDLPKLLHSMKGATDRIKDISTSLRTFSRADTDYKMSANLHEGMESTLLILKYRLKANEYRPAIQILQDYGELPAIECFPGQLNQVFMNILANAIDMFDEMAQQSSFEALEAHPQQITICTTRLENDVQIRIRDNGKGMSETVKAKVFDHLFTTKGVGKGTGLGLAIARQIVTEKHNGSLAVQTALGQGSEFDIRLPIS